jgi:hypothetical protein
MKNDRHITLGSGKTSARREWPQPADLSPARTSTVAAAATRGPAQGFNEPPVRPVPGWRLPSGQLLVEYALRAGLASSPLLVRLPLLGGGTQGAGMTGNGQGTGVGDAAPMPSLGALAGGLRGKSGASGIKSRGTQSAGKRTSRGRA